MNSDFISAESSGSTGTIDNRSIHAGREKSEISHSTAAANREAKHSSRDEMEQRQLKCDPVTRETS